MTFVQLQDRVMGRLNLTTSESRTRIKGFLNERYRRLQTSIGLGQVRRTQISLATVVGQFEYPITTLIKVITVTYPTGNRVIGELSLDQIRRMDPDGGQTGVPQAYAVTKYAADSVTIYVWPKPDAIYTLQIDGLARGTDMTADADLPAFPEDFHDYLVFAGCADELEKMEKGEASARMEIRAKQRSEDLRYFLAKSAYLSIQQSDNWWSGPFGGGFFGWGDQYGWW